MSDSTFEKMLAALTPDVVANLKRAVEIGKWPDGRRLTQEQREISLQAVIAWEMKHLPETERTGYIDKTEKEGEVCDHDHTPHDQEAPVRFMH